MIHRIATIFGQEFRLARRNHWVVLATVILTLFAVSLGFFGAGQGAGLKADVLTLTSASLATLSVYLIPLIALLMSYDAFAGEIERGALALAFATPVRRWEVFAGKLIAQVSAMAIAVVLSFALAGAALAFAFGTSPEGLAAWGRLVGSAVWLGAVFVCIGLMLSAFSARTARAAAAAIGTWLVFVVLYDLALLGGIMAAGEGVFASRVFPWLVVANPADAFRLYNLAALETAPVAGIDGLARTLPFPPETGLAAIALWLVAALALGIHRTKRIVP
ncbi:ABC transporter permease [Maritimibacter sp. DP1N21-5]|uniref:ABC transporter permease n=1 Tax=Maritimibacter sp. DP1N21-5 TaxID=2836867 RepID=UPI001C476E78|nr:ABC transporter permease subunit [Maritimibacter sp. DP1N21-5]MBV7410075.1 ABC transporter permease [Maritimibacter sp. DP1N21-5]